MESNSASRPQARQPANRLNRTAGPDYNAHANGGGNCNLKPKSASMTNCTPPSSRMTGRVRAPSTGTCSGECSTSSPRARPRSVLEVGCGSGLFAEMLVKETQVAYRGFDFSPVGIAHARARLPGAALFVGDALAPASYSGDYDCIICSEVLEHIAGDLDVIALWPRGTLCVCSVPNFDYPTHVRRFRTEHEVRERYGEAIDIKGDHANRRPGARRAIVGGVSSPPRWRPRGAEAAVGSSGDKRLRLERRLVHLLRNQALSLYRRSSCSSWPRSCPPWSRSLPWRSRPPWS